MRTGLLVSGFDLLYIYLELEGRKVE